MSAQLDPATREALAARLRFYRELGMGEFYQREPSQQMMERFAAAASAVAAEAAVAEPAAPVAAAPNALPELPDLAPLPTMPEPVVAAVKSYTPAERLVQIREEIGNCERCPLHSGRHSIVFGDGSATTKLMFVGEGPGADEDAQGLPFVGRAGQLLNNMIVAMGVRRDEVYIANVVKCRPPGNRTPEPDEMATCQNFLYAQIEAIRPQVIVALGATAATSLLGVRQPLAGLRNRIHEFRGSQVIVTYHPAFLLRDPRMKKEAWSDLQIAMRELGLKAPARK